MSSEFDTEEKRIRDVYAARNRDREYSWFNADHVDRVQEQHRAVLAALQAAGFTSLGRARILDVGCGNGHWIRQFVEWGATPENVTGVDLLADRIANARATCPAGIALHCGNVAAIDAADATFDIVMQSTVFTSILDRELRRHLAAEMVRVLKPGGVILWYDFMVRNPSNPDVRPVGKAELYELFNGSDISLRRMTLAPPIARALASRAAWLCRALSLVPFLRTHYLATIRPQRTHETN